MSDPVVHFEIIGADPGALRAFYGELFGWSYDVGGATAPEVSADGEYGFVNPPEGEGPGIPGGVAGGAGYEPHALFYVGVADVGAALERALALGGTRVFGPSGKPGGGLVVARFTDPEGNLVGLAGER